jgi:hypothetical protein
MRFALTAMELVGRTMSAAEALSGRTIPSDEVLLLLVRQVKLGL